MLAVKGFCHPLRDSGLGRYHLLGTCHDVSFMYHTISYVTLEVYINNLLTQGPNISANDGGAQTLVLIHIFAGPQRGLYE